MTNYQGKRVLIIGAARQGLALARFLSNQQADVTINDSASSEKLASAITSFSDLPVSWVTGGHPLEMLDGKDILFVSGGIPLTLPVVQEAVTRGIPVSNDTQVFLEQSPATVIGITGSAGKTTTTTLVGRMAKAAVKSNQQAWIGGNIGQPLITHVAEMNQADVVVMEVSSFQLEQTTISPHIAAILNITPNHLDRHGTMDAYTTAKARILAFQSEKDIAILNREDSGSWNLRKSVKGNLVTFGEKPIEAGTYTGTYVQDDCIFYVEGKTVEEMMPISTIELRGRHNLMNVLAACAIGKAAGFDNKSIVDGIAGFGGVAHRLELVRELKGVRWYNDSIATAPERSMAAIRSFSEPIVLLAGGRDKNLPWQEFAALATKRLEHLVLFGEAADKIEAAIQSADQPQHLKSVTRCNTLQEAVHAAANLVKAGDVVLLSPGGTSYDAFKDFEERGEAFRLWVQQLS